VQCIRHSRGEDRVVQERREDRPYVNSRCLFFCRFMASLSLPLLASLHLSLALSPCPISLSLFLSLPVFLSPPVPPPSLCLSFCLRFNSHFPSELGLPGTRLSPFCILLELRVMEMVVTTVLETCKLAKLQSKCHHQQTNTQSFYRPDALPVAQPTVSEM